MTGADECRLQEAEARTHSVMPPLVQTRTQVQSPPPCRCALPVYLFMYVNVLLHTTCWPDSSKQETHSTTVPPSHYWRNNQTRLKMTSASRASVSVTASQSSPDHRVHDVAKEQLTCPPQTTPSHPQHAGRSIPVPQHNSCTSNISNLSMNSTHPKQNQSRDYGFHTSCRP